MNYENTVFLLDTEGGPLTTNVTARLWRLYDENFGSHHFDKELETQAFDLSLGGSTGTYFSFTGDTSLYVRDGFGFSIQDSLGVAPLDYLGHPGANDRGWLFRSGWYPQSFPTGPSDWIEVVAGKTVITAADLPSILPEPKDFPLTVDANTTITGLWAQLEDGNAVNFPQPHVLASATGTSTTMAGDVGFNFSVRLVLTTSPEIAAPEVQAVAVEIGDEHVQLTSGPGLATFDKAGLLLTLRDFMTDTAGPQIGRKIESRLTNAIVAAVGRSLGTGQLAAGVILSIRTLQVNAVRIEVRGALGAFGGVISKLPPIAGSGGSGTTCALQTLASLGYGVFGLQVLREVRDGGLAATETGRWATEAYYRFGDEASVLLVRNPLLAARAAAIAHELAAALRAGMTVPNSLRRRYEDVLRDVAAIGSPELRAAVAHGLEAGVTRLL